MASLNNALHSGVTGIKAFSTQTSTISGNMANVATIGFKKSVTEFKSLISTVGGNVVTQPTSGVVAKNRQLVDQAGPILPTDSRTDVAIDGRGFFVVNTKADGTGENIYTRAGSFSENSKGDYVNPEGLALMAWALDNEGRLPGDPGNAANTTPNSLLQSLSTVNLKKLTGAASATTNISLGMNLSQQQKIVEGAGETIKFGPLAVANFGNNASDPISPEGDGLRLNIGDLITVTPSNPGIAYEFVYGGISRSRDIAGTILGAGNSQEHFKGPGVEDGHNFDIIVDGVPLTFTFKVANPISGRGEFNTLDNLATAINQNPNIKARVVSDGLSTRLVVSPVNANHSMVFRDPPGNLTGTFVDALGLFDSAADPSGKRFSSLNGLAKIVNNTTGIKAKIPNSDQGATLRFYSEDPLGTINVASTSAGAYVGVRPDSYPASTSEPALVTDPSKVLKELGLNPKNPENFGPAYDPSDALRNMSGGSTTPHFARNIQIYDAFGSPHNIQVSYLKIGINTWGMEVYTKDPSELISARRDGQLAAGTVMFNGDGSLKFVSPSLTQPMVINWANAAAPSSILFKLGTAGDIKGTPGALAIGDIDGLTQVDAGYNVTYEDRNGIPPGLLSYVFIDKNGGITASFTNGSSKKVYQIPVAGFQNPNGLQDRGGNVYSATNESGTFNLRIPGTGGAGEIRSSALEQSNVDLADELTALIVAQRNYQASTKAITTADEMLERLTNI